MTGTEKTFWLSLAMLVLAVVATGSRLAAVALLAGFLVPVGRRQR